MKTRNYNPKDYITIENDGPRILRTNYWLTEYAAEGFAYLSGNAGTYRLLLPQTVAEEVVEAARSSVNAALTRGQHRDFGREMIEILLDDRSNNPYAMHLATQQLDRLWTTADELRREPRELAIYTLAGLQLTLPLILRTAKSLPFLRPWGVEGKV